jgi:hypothetical protein
MKTILVCKAEPILKTNKIAPVILSVSQDLPPFDHGTSLDTWYAFADEQARLVVDALEHLPGGVLDRVLIELMARKVSAFRVPLWERGK